MVLAAVSVLIGAAIQSAVGFGFALVAAPLVFVALGPEEAVWSLNAISLCVNGAAFALERRRPAAYGRLAVTVLCWSVPGMLAGGYILRATDARVLQIALTVTVLLTLVVRLRPARAAAAPPAGAAAVTGVVTGVLTTSLSTAGPPLVLLLTGRGFTPMRVRDTLATIFVAQSALGLAALAVTSAGDVPLRWRALVLLAAALAGQLAGRRIFHRIAEHDRYEQVLTAVLVVAVTVGLVVAVA